MGGDVSEPTLGEVLRRLEDVARRLESAEATYVRKDVYDARHNNVTRRVEQIETEMDAREKSAEAFRRQVLLLVIGLAIPAVVSLLLAVNNFLASGGATP